MKQSEPEKPRHPRDLVIIGLLFYGIGYILSQTTAPLVFGSFALVSGLVLWGSRALGRPRLGAYLVRGFFLIAAAYWLYTAVSLLRADLLLGTLLSLVFAGFLYFIWDLTWGFTTESQRAAEEKA